MVRLITIVYNTFRMRQPKTRYRTLTGIGMVAAGLCLLLPACKGNLDSFEITEAKTCSDVDADLKPVDVSSEFPAGTDHVRCWFSWKNAKRGMKLTARWYNTAEDIHILDYPLTLTRRSDNGIVSLQMSKGKTLPPGSYRVDLATDVRLRSRVVKSVPFTVLPPTPESSASSKPSGPSSSPASP